MLPPQWWIFPFIIVSVILHFLLVRWSTLVEVAHVFSPCCSTSGVDHLIELRARTGFFLSLFEAGLLEMLSSTLPSSWVDELMSWRVDEFMRHRGPSTLPSLRFHRYASIASSHRVDENFPPRPRFEPRTFRFVAECDYLKPYLKKGCYVTCL